MVSAISIISLAAVDAVNPCALAVMAIVLMTILMHDPTKRRNVLLGGLAFVSAVFILYFIYGSIMIQFFSHALPETGVISNYIFKGFGIFAIILGIFNIKDYLQYRPGSCMTEMPLHLRPKMKRHII